MNGYINSLLAVMIVCQVTVLISYESEYAVSGIRFVCALVVLLTVLTPCRNLIGGFESFTETITAFFEAGSTVVYEETESGAAALMQYVTEQYGISELSVVLLTDDTDSEITEFRMYIPDCPYARRAAIESDLNSQLNFPVYVFGK